MTPRLESSYENRLNQKAPFGLVTSFWKIEVRKNAALVEEATIKLTLTDTGSTAVSELPDKK